MRPEDKKRIVEILDETDDMTLATQRNDGFPQATVVAFVNDGLTLWFGTSPDSQKASNLASNDKVSATVTPPYDSWDDIAGLSLGGHATLVDDPQELAKVERLLLEKFPKIRDYVPLDGDAASLALYRIDPTVVSLIDHERGFGHTEQFDV